MCLCHGKHGLAGKGKNFRRYVESDGSSIIGKVPSGLVTPTEAEVFKSYEDAVLRHSSPSAQTVEDFKVSLYHQWAALPLDLSVVFTHDDPYTTPEQLFESIRAGRLLVFDGAEDFLSDSPLGEPAYAEGFTGKNWNDMLRALHDFYGHYLGDNNFSWDGEHGAFLSHAKMFPHDCTGILEAEVLGQAAWRLIKGEYITPQPFVSMIVL